MHVVLTVDTEPSVAGVFADPERRKPLIDECVDGVVNGHSEALGFMLDTLARHRLPATFFVETLHTRAFGEAAMGKYVERILAGGHDAQLHFHPVWRSWSDRHLNMANRSTDTSASLARAELSDIMGEGMNQLHRWTGRVPSSARVGNFSTGMAVLEASADVGLRYTSHICLAHRPPEEAELRLAGGVHDIAGVRELPVTCFADRSAGGRDLRPLQVNAVSAREMQTILDGMQRAGEPVAIIVTHPFDLLKRKDKQFTGMRADRLVQQRWSKLLAFLDAERGRFQTSTLEAAGRHSPPTASPKLTGSRLHGTARAVRNYVNDRYL